MKKSSIEMMVGIFVLIGALCVGYLTIKLGKMEMFGDDYYTVKARFESVAGLKTGADVEIAGVLIGKVQSIALSHELQIALVELNIKKEFVLTDDVMASVKTSGLIGDKYIQLIPGGSEIILKSGDLITETESSLDIEELISKYVFGSL